MKNTHRKPEEVSLVLSAVTPKGEIIFHRLHADIDGYREATIDDQDMIKVVRWLRQNDGLFMTASLRKARDDMEAAAQWMLLRR
jgi:hypothetical protein